MFRKLQTNTLHPHSPIPTPMNFCVCIKQVPDVAAPTRIQGGTLLQDTDRMVLNAYDASAVEEALVLTAQYGGEVDVLLIGPEKAKETVRKALAMGADRGIHVAVEQTEELDAWAYAQILAAQLKTGAYDVISCGKQAQDTDAGLTGSMLAALLEVPYATNAVGLDVEPDQNILIVTRQGDTGQEIIALPAPCLVTCSNDMNDPRIPKLRDIMLSKKKPIDTVTLEALGLAHLGSGYQPRTRVLAYQDLPAREPGKKLEGPAEEIAAQAIELLQNEAKVL